MKELWDYELKNEVIVVSPRFKRVLGIIKGKKNMRRRRRKQFTNPEVTDELAVQLEELINKGVI